MTSQAGATNQCVAFLRGINVGGNRLIKMDELRRAFESLEFQNVKTLLASGNVIFETSGSALAELTKRIEKGLEEIFGYRIDVLLRPMDQLEKIVKANPFKGITVTPDIRLYVSFLAKKPITKLKIPYESPERNFRILRVSDGAVFSVLYVSESMKTTDPMNIVGKEFGKKITTRNWNTVMKLVKIDH